ncbi:MAG TPA: RHS repeat-associated core domain-containing protein [Phycisphaerae bacterium]|nr:RHS repeat-associated core domain-containing protein [Phycisphaerae bacterium]
MLDLADQVISSSFANGVSSVFDYDVNGRMTHMERFKNGAPPTMLVEYDYGHDAVGNRLYTRDLMATDRSELYEHDSRNRLRNFERGTLNTAGDDITTPLVDPVLPSQQQWTDLDRRGNWLDFSTTLNGQPAVQQTRTVNGVNEVLTLDPDGSGGQSPYTLANDNNGNLTENPWAFNADDSGAPTGHKYEYDEENRLIRVRRLSNNEILLEIGYDAVGRRVESKEYLDAQTQQMLTTARVTHHVVVGAMVIEEYDITDNGSGGTTATMLREFVWGAEYPMPVAMVDWTTAGEIGQGQAEALHYLRDVLYSVVAMTNASGNVVERYRYDPYGMTHIYNAGGMLLPTSAYGNPYAYTGQRYDPAVALYHFYWRTYSPSLGRWHQRDPLGYVGGVSLYEYVASLPTVLIDPFGLEGDAAKECADIAAAIEKKIAAGEKYIGTAAEGVSAEVKSVEAVFNTGSDSSVVVKLRDVATGADDIVDLRPEKAAAFVKGMGTLEQSLPLSKWARFARGMSKLARWAARITGRALRVEAEGAWWMLPQQEKDKVLPPSNEEIQERRERLYEQYPGLWYLYEQDDWRQPIV